MKLYYRIDEVQNDLGLQIYRRTWACGIRDGGPDRIEVLESVEIDDAIDFADEAANCELLERAGFTAKELEKKP